MWRCQVTELRDDVTSSSLALTSDPAVLTAAGVRIKRNVSLLDRSLSRKTGNCEEAKQFETSGMIKWSFGEPDDQALVLIKTKFEVTQAEEELLFESISRVFLFSYFRLELRTGIFTFNNNSVTLYVHGTQSCI